jgi:fructose-1,6-bisphosphatase/inositol monophosphatase family enzyme
MSVANGSNLRGLRRAQARIVCRGARPRRAAQRPTDPPSLYRDRLSYDPGAFCFDLWEPFIVRTQGERHTGSAVLDRCYIARGWVDALWEFGLRPWDVAAGALIVIRGGRPSD